jgi:hypothetical protein
MKRHEMRGAGSGLRKRSIRATRGRQAHLFPSDITDFTHIRNTVWGPGVLGAPITAPRPARPECHRALAEAYQPGLLVRYARAIVGRDASGWGTLPGNAAWPLRFRPGHRRSSTAMAGPASSALGVVGLVP